MPSFANRNDVDIRTSLQVVKIFTDAQHSALTMQVLCKCLSDGSLRKGILEDFARGLTHAAKLTFAINGSGHGKDYRGKDC